MIEYFIFCENGFFIYVLILLFFKVCLYKFIVYVMCLFVLKLLLLCGNMLMN